VRNRNDGAVEAVFEGGDDAVEAMVSWCRQGPPRARVDRVEVVDEPAEGLRGFRVKGWD
jgi:acylphosphatase